MGYEDDEDDYAERLDLRGAVEREDEDRWYPFFQGDEDQDAFDMNDEPDWPEPSRSHYVRRKKLWKKR